MSQQNVEAFKRGLDPLNRRDLGALLEELAPEVELHPAEPALLGGEATVYRGHEGAREEFRDVYQAFAELHIEILEIRDLGDRVVAIGRIRARGRESGAETESPWAYLVRFMDGKAIWGRSYLDPREALEAVGLSE